jgi:hypothetical protein
MADPTLALTFSDLILRVAEYLGVALVSGSSAAAVPTDAHDLDLCKRIVNDGYRKFLLAHTRWRFLRPVSTITFIADTATYDMPAGFFGSIADDKFMPAAATGKPIIAIVPDAYIQQMKVAGAVTGDPAYCSVRPKTVAQDNTGVAPRWQAEFWPTPSSAYAVTAPIRLIPGKLVNLTDTPVAGFQHADTILAFALAEAERTRDDKSGVQAAHASAMLAQSKAIDAEAAPRRRGYNGDRSDDGSIRPGMSYTGVDTYNGNAV